MIDVALYQIPNYETDVAELRGAGCRCGDRR